MSVVALGCVAALLAGGCGGGSRGQTSGATVPTLPATTSTTTDPFAVPDVITLEYLDRVLAELDRIDGEATRKIVAAKELTPEAIALIESIYAEPELPRRLSLWERDLENDLPGAKDNPKARTTSTNRLISSSTSCLFAAVMRDYSGPSLFPPPPEESFIALRPSGANFSGWVIVFDGFNADGSEPPNPCAH